MTIKVRQRTYKETGHVTWQADIHVKLLDGRVIRERCKVPTASSRTAAERWAKEREAARRAVPCAARTPGSARAI